MFSAKNKNNTDAPKFAFIQFRPGEGTFPSIQETNITKLNELILKAVAEKDLSTANLYAKKMSIYYGVPGLIHFYNLNIRFLASEKADGEMIDRPALSGLGFLFLAKLIYEKDPNIATIVEQLMPEENISSPDYWSKKIEMTNALVDVKVLYPQAEAAAQRMYKPSHVDASPGEGNTGLKK